MKKKQTKKQKQQTCKEKVIKKYTAMLGLDAIALA